MRNFAVGASPGDNLSIRTFQRRFTRLALGFSKKLETADVPGAAPFCYTCAPPASHSSSGGPSMSAAEVRRRSPYPPGLVGSGPLLDRPVIRLPASVGTFAGFREWVEGKNRPGDVTFDFLGDHIRINLVPEGRALHLPTSIFTYEGFCDWAASDAYPERGRISYLNGEVVIDMSPEEIETHNQVKEAVNREIGNLNRALDLGRLFPDGVQLRNDAIGLNTVPDGMLVRWEAFESGRVRLVPRRRRPDEHVQLNGTPDWVLEVVSQDSVTKDTRTLRRLYFRQGIPEYWLINARGDDIDFQMLVRGRTRYAAVKPRDGWLASPVFGRSFRLRRRNRLGMWIYTLHVRPD
jgi:Uma2 family endonuclease